jgi:hypothetical protein
MITYSKVKSAIIENGKRILKVLEFGAKTAVEVAPFGDDGNPVKDMTAIYGRTSASGDAVILGYINKNQLATPGEKRIYSLKPDGGLSIDIFLRTDGTMEIGGNTDNMVKFIPLDAALKNQDTLINAELIKIASAIAALGGAYAPITVATDISPSKLDTIKTA